MKRIIFLVTLCLLMTATAQAVSDILINSGGPAHIDTEGRTWSGDKYFSFGWSVAKNTSISGTSDDPLYYDYRVGSSFSYNIPTGSGQFGIELHFAETHFFKPWFPGPRVFNVSIEGQPALIFFNILNETNANTALIKSFNSTVSDNMININFKASQNNAMISAIRIYNLSAANATNQTNQTSNQSFFAAYRINSGGSSITDIYGNNWNADSGFNTGNNYSIGSSRPIGLTDIDQIYQSERWDPTAAPELTYNLPVQNGEYEIYLHFAEIYSGASFPGARIFNVSVEGKTVAEKFDVFDTSGGALKAKIVRDIFNITDGSINILFKHIKENPKISGIEVFRTGEQPLLGLSDNEIELGHVDAVGESTPNSSLTIRNFGQRGLIISNLTLMEGSNDFKIHATPPLVIPPESGLTIDIHFTASPSSVEDNHEHLMIYSNAPGSPHAVELHGGLENHSEDSDGGLHPVIIATPLSAIDVDGNGVEQIHFDGTSSHYHTYPFIANPYKWFLNNAYISNQSIFDYNVPVGTNIVTLQVTNTQNDSLNTSVSILVLKPGEIPGLIMHAYNMSGKSFSGYPNFASFVPDFGQIVPNIDVQGSPFNGTSFTQNFGAVYNGVLEIETAGNHQFRIETDGQARLFIDSILVINNGTANGNKSLSVGAHPMRLEYLNSGSPLIRLFRTKPGGVEETIPPEFNHHNDTGLKPTINSVAYKQGLPIGGNKIVIKGLGFIFSSANTTVKVGNNFASGVTRLDDFNLLATLPSGSGTTDVMVATPNGASNNKSFTYNASAPVPINFRFQAIHNITNPTTLAFGPDERLYVATSDGLIQALTLNDQNNVIAVENITSVQALGSHNWTFPWAAPPELHYESILGLAFNPLDNPNDPTLYVSHSKLFYAKGFYNGSVSRLRKSTNWTLERLITGLPISWHDHAVNGLEFSDDGQMYIAIGGNTNAGVPGFTTGFRDEATLTAAILVANISDPNFNGKMTYDVHNKDLQNSNILSGDVKVFASGFRNPYDLMLHSNGYIYATDNGPGFDTGSASLDCNINGSIVLEGPDELNLVEKDGFYGHPNRNRGRTDSRQCKFHSVTEPDDSPDYIAPLTTLIPSTDGIIEYRSNTFKGQMRGTIVTSKLLGPVFVVKLSPDGRSVEYDKTIPTPEYPGLEELLWNGGLDVTEGFGGQLFVAKYPAGDDSGSNNIINMLTPLENSMTRITSVFPRRAPRYESRAMLITGVNFTTSGGTTATFGNVACAINSVTATKIRCTLPATSTIGNVDINVINGGRNITLANAYRFMAGIQPQSPPAGGVNGTWIQKTSAPFDAFENAAAAVDGKIYLFGGNESNQSHLQIYDVANDSWSFGAHIPENPGNHISAQSIGTKIYLIGGINPETSKLRIYDTLTDSWSEGAPITADGAVFAVGSTQSAVLGGKIYVFGGLHFGTDTNQSIVYDPLSDTWSDLPDVPFGLSHGGIGTDGSKIYIFSGRKGPNFPSTGPVNATQVFDPATNTWAVVPIQDRLYGRTGLGDVPFVSGEFIVMGGENIVTEIVSKFTDAFNPITGQWRVLPDMPIQRHAFDATVVNGNIYVAGGGTSFGDGQTNLNYVYLLNNATPPINNTNNTNNTPSFALRINAGGQAFIDNLGQQWVADSGYFNTGNSYSVNKTISGTQNQKLYQTNRWDSSSVPEMKYTMPILAGNYTVNLHFAETFFSKPSLPGPRIFNVTIENQNVLSNFNVLDYNNGSAALIRSFNTTVSDGNIEIEFKHVTENPFISGIEILGR